MTREKAISKEIEFLLQRHNNKTAYKVKKIEVDLPDYIVEILCQREKRTKEQQIVLQNFKKELEDKLLAISQEIKENQLAKAKESREKRYANDPRYVKHFGIWVDQSKTSSRINREYYAEINPKSSIIKYKDIVRNPRLENNKDLIIDHEKKTVYYTEAHCYRLQKRAMENYDINMRYYASLDQNEFEEAVQKFIKRRGFREITDLYKIETIFDEEYLGGYVYLMILGEYKQVYIGMTERADVTERIKEHWTRKRAFDRLVFGSTSNSHISIDSFGPLDTTQIYIKACTDPIRTENRYIRLFDKRFLLNRLQ